MVSFFFYSVILGKREKFDWWYWWNCWPSMFELSL